MLSNNRIREELQNDKFFGWTAVKNAILDNKCIIIILFIMKMFRIIKRILFKILYN